MKKVFLNSFIMLVTILIGSELKSQENNTWYVFNSSKTVFIFVHGIFSNSTDCWTSEKGVFWPDLLKNDKRFEQPSIFLGGYYTDYSSGIYNITDASNELLSYLGHEDSIGNASPLQKDNIVFIAHSTGGLVVQYMLERNLSRFKNKSVGLVLLAAPSRGSAWANRLNWISEFFNNKMAMNLQRDNDLITDIDKRFADLVSEKQIPKFVGVDAFENKFIFKSGFFNKEHVVTATDAGSYFGGYKIIPNTDHFSIAKPSSVTHPSHQLLLEFYQDKFKKLTEKILEIYPIIDIDTNKFDSTSEVIEEGIGFGNTQLNLRYGNKDLFDSLKNNQNKIFAISVHGNCKVPDCLIEDAKLSLQFLINYEKDDELQDYKPIVLHFPSSDHLKGWNSWYEAPETSRSQYFKILGFFRIVNEKWKMDMWENYILEPVAPESEKASNTLNVIKCNKNGYLFLNDNKIKNFVDCSAQGNN